MPKTEKRKCSNCNKEVIVSEGIEKYNPKTMKYDAYGDLYKTKRCADCGELFELHRMRSNPQQRPKIPLKPMSEKMKGISALLWFLSWITLVLALVMGRFEYTIVFWIVILTYSMTYLKSNIAQCFQRKYLKKGLFYLPLLFIPKFLCEQLLARANIWWLNLGISINFLFGSVTSQVTDWLTFFITLALLCFLFFPCNYYEEYYFRSKWYLVGIWALLHLFLGFSQFTLGEFFILCGLGIGFKLIYDRHGIEISYDTHLFTNFATVFIALILALSGI